MIRSHLAVVALLIGGLAPACAKPEPPPPPDEATLRAEDKRELERIVAIDVRASIALREADDATRVGDSGAAASAVKTKAAPAVEEALRAAEGSSMKSTWGKAKRDELLAIFRDRKTEMPKYEAAVAGNDPEKMLAAIQAQAAIERRALATVAAVQEGR